VNDLFEHVLHNLSDSDTVGIKIPNCVNQKDKPIGNSYRRKDLLGEKCYGASLRESHNRTLYLTPWTGFIDRTFGEVALRFGKHAMKSRFRQLSAMAHLKASVVKEKATENCLPTL